MKEILVKVFDDLDFTRHGERNEATGTLAVGLEGIWSELDLSAENEKRVRELLGELMAAGHDPDKTPSASHTGSKKYTPPTEETFAFYEGLRAWVRANGWKNRARTGWAYQTNKTLQYYYSVKLKQEYQAYLAEQARTGD
jgi:hypothetical protein